MAEEKGGLQETNEPRKKSGQTSQDNSIQPPPSAVEQEKNKKGVRPGDPDPLNPGSDYR